MIVDEVDRSIAVRLQVFELGHHVFRATRTPLALIEDRDVAENARPWTAARSLHRGEALHREHGRYVQGHRLDEIEWQSLAVRKRPLVEIALRGPVRVVQDFAVASPGESRDSNRIFKLLGQV